MDDTTVATKADIETLMEQMGKYYVKTERKILESEKRIRKEFKVVSEQNRADVLGIHNDKISLLDDTVITHGKRIKVLEKVVGVL